jgi:HAD superfamily hydrolase (TIGR01450 family)
VRVSIAEDHDAFLFDLDGVLYRGDVAVPDAARSVEKLREMGKCVAFVTNNGSRSPQAVAEHLGLVGVTATAGEIETSALTTGSVLAARGVSSAYVLGGPGAIDALESAGIAVVPDAAPAEVVVVSWDTALTYDRLRLACQHVDAGAGLIATNADRTYPAADGRTWPGAGSILAAVEAGTGARAEVMGKPEAPILLAALARAGGGRPLVIGDRMETDIEGAARLGWDSLLVLTGITGRSDLGRESLRPTFVADTLAGLFEG